jgi:hypothetical protein
MVSTYHFLKADINHGDDNRFERLERTRALKSLSSQKRKYNEIKF